MRRVTELGIKDSDPRVSPDGRRVLFQDREPSEESAGAKPPVRLFVYDLATKARARLANVPGDAKVVCYCWSPDGAKVAYTWRRKRPDQPQAAFTESRNTTPLRPETESFLVVADADGGSPRTVLSGTAGAGTTVGTVGWRR